MSVSLLYLPLLFLSLFLSLSHFGVLYHIILTIAQSAFKDEIQFVILGKQIKNWGLD